MNEQPQKAIIRTMHSITCGDAKITVDLCDDTVYIKIKPNNMYMHDVTIELSRDVYSDFVSELYKTS